MCDEKDPSVSVNISSFTSLLIARLIELSLSTMCWFCPDPREGLTRTERRRSPVSTTLVLPIMLNLLASFSFNKFQQISFLQRNLLFNKTFQRITACQKKWMDMILPTFMSMHINSKHTDGMSTIQAGRKVEPSGE